MTISLPPEMLRQFETVRKLENRTRFELVREALRSHFESRHPAVKPAKIELAAIRRGRAAYARGDYRELDLVLNDLEDSPNRPGAKALAKASGKRTRTP